MATCRKEETFAHEMKKKTDSLSISIHMNVSQYPDEEKIDVKMLANANDPMANWKDIA